jgi:hypothetical protein
MPMTFLGSQHYRGNHARIKGDDEIVFEYTNGHKYAYNCWPT